MSYDVFDFIADPRQPDVEWWVDPETELIVTRCPDCGVEARHGNDGLLDFRFAHKSDCITGMPPVVCRRKRRWAM